MFSFFKESPAIIPQDVKKLLQESGTLFIDVREKNEYESGHAQGAVSYPLSTFNNTLADELKNFKVVYVICQSGGRSSRAVEFLQKVGVNAINVTGGTSAWKSAGLVIE